MERNEHTTAHQKLFGNEYVADRSKLYEVALNVAAPHFESVRNCEPVRLLMTQYTKREKKGERYQLRMEHIEPETRHRGREYERRTQSQQVERIVRH